jgi:hypothetical protein
VIALTVAPRSAEEADFMFAQLPSLTELESMTIDDRWGVVGDRHLSIVGSLPNMKVIDLRCRNITAAGIRAVAGLPSLRVLSCDASSDLDLCLRELAVAKGLVALRIRVSDGDSLTLAPMGRLSALQELIFVGEGSDFDVWELAALDGLPCLDRLSLVGLRLLGRTSEARRSWKLRAPITVLTMSHVEIDGEDLMRIVSAPHLKVIKVTDLEANGDCTLSALVNAAQVSALEIAWSPQVDDSTLVHLARMRGLTDVKLIGCPQVTAEGLLQFLDSTSLKRLDAIGIRPSIAVVELRRRSVSGEIVAATRDRSSFAP